VTLLNRLEDQYPNQPEFKQGYIDGFKDATTRREVKTRIKNQYVENLVKNSNIKDGRLLDSVTQLTDRLTTIERTHMQQSSGDEGRMTKIFHVCTCDTIILID